jgi:chromosome segregation protein
VKFSKLLLLGFKSFVDPTELYIEPGLTGIVGPNGCGKSNLVEALRWAMGETSAKSLRGSGMDDVIFSGTEGRPARNMAEVSIVLDNAERGAAAAFNDADIIEVTRRIEREAGSTYSVNAQEVRARDVQLLFADASTGAVSSALVRQGQIGQIINAKPEARRRILEEAAGITGLHSRRHEAELRLRAAEQNLERLADVIAQIESQLAGLKRQARQAKRYRNVSHDIRRAEALLFYLRWQQIGDALAAEENRLRALERELADRTADAAAASRTQAEAAESLPALREAEARAAAALQRLGHERDRLDADAERARQELARAQERRAETLADLAREEAQLGDAAAEKQRLAQEQSLLIPSENETLSLVRAQEELEKAENALKLAEERLETATREAMVLSAQRQSLIYTIAQNQARFDRLTGEIAEAQRQIATLALSSEEKARTIELEGQVTRAESDAEAALATVLAAETARQEADRQASEAAEPAQNAEREVERLSAEAATIAAMLGGAESDLWPPLVDAVRVEPDHEIALAAAFGDDLDAPADRAAAIHWDTLAPLDDVAPLPDGAIPLARFVSGPAAIERRLSQVGLVARENGKKLQSRLRPGQRLVSREGDLWRWDGYTAAAEAPTLAARRLVQRNRLREVEQLIAQAQARARDMRAELSSAQDNAAKARTAEAEARARARQADMLLSQGRAAFAASEKKLAETRAGRAGLEASLARLEQELKETREALGQAETVFETLPAQENADEAARTHREMVTAERERVAQLRAAYEEMRREASTRAERLAMLRREGEAWGEREMRAHNHGRILAARLEELAREIARLTALPEKIEESRAALLTRWQEADTHRKTAADNLAQAETRLRAAEQTARQSQDALAEVREKRAGGEAHLQGTRERQADIAHMISESLGCTPDRLAEEADITPGKLLPSLEETERKVERYKRERESLGGVNLRAEEEVAEVEEQLSRLMTEKTDLDEAIARLRHGIGMLNREGRTRLMEAFDRVNANFADLFTRLFGGGTAHLALTESDDPLLAGLEIMARPPGKRLQSLSLLSGGEQALTALSLIFAVFLTNPAPICVLDEVDAPLDDANVQRFCDLMHHIADTTKTRFLVITHHALTISHMNRLYGVTMAERGVSQLVSVDLDNAERLREAG